MPSIADMERQDRLSQLWSWLTSQLNPNMRPPAGAPPDPVSLLTRGGYGQQAIDPYMALRLLQVGQQSGAPDQDMIAQLIQTMMKQQPQR